MHTFFRAGGAQFRGAGNVELSARSGNVDNPDRNWSQWTRDRPRRKHGIGVPPARFVQWKSVLHAGTPAPHVDDVLVNYLPKNITPEVDDILVQLGYRYQPVPRGTVADATASGQPRLENLPHACPRS